ncbi:DUF2382 domain-containing protein [Pantanalinema rosaneae CENA516]|uniref:DUF2382 domain-containing protein n=1 Tax=Pantanalinema rosaneae TaxID=1620701 RepID=UPI003D6E9310
MPLYKIKDFDSDYRNGSDYDVLSYDLYAGNDKVGSVDDLLVDDQGKLRYLVVNTGVWIFGKKVLLPVGLANINGSDRRVYTDGLTRTQVEDLPEYRDDMTVDYDQEERVRGIYRPMASSRMNRTTAVDQSAALDSSTALGSTPLDSSATAYNRPASYDRNSYRYDYDANLYDLNDRDHQSLRLYEERLIANKTRRKTGEVAVGKHVETETAHVSVPIERERVVIERTTPTDANAVVSPDAHAFGEGEVARVEVYEETPDIRKEAFVREEVRVRKEVERETVDAEETLRRERLDINKDGNPVLEDSERRRNDRI